MSNLDDYIERYCRQYGYTPEEAKNHALVKEVRKYYEEEDNEKIDYIHS